MEQSGDFAADCRRLFAPEHGRRWKTAAAAALAIGRTTLYRYLSGEQPVPVPIRARLAALAREPAKPYSAGRTFLGDEKMTPEQHIADSARPFTGAEYIESLKDGREVYINGERVRDVTTHPAFRNSVRSLARLYDALHEPERKDVLTCPTDTGSRSEEHTSELQSHVNLVCRLLLEKKKKKKKIKQNKNYNTEKTNRVI